MSRLAEQIALLKQLQSDLDVFVIAESELTATQWDKTYLLMFDNVEQQRAYVKELKLYKKLGKYFDLWA